MKKESKLLIWYLFLVGAICIVNYIIRITIHPAKVNDPIYYKSGGCIVTLSLLGYILYVWKSDTPELLRRLIRAIPFVLMFLVLIKATGIKIFWSIALGVMLCLFLLFKTPNWKKHFLALLTPAFLSLIFLKFFIIPFHESQDISFAKPILLGVGFVLLYSFPALYLSKLGPTKTPDLKPILVRSIKFDVAVSLFFAAFLFLNGPGNRLSLSPSSPVRLLMSIFLSILFLFICYKFDILLVERTKTSKKRNMLSERWEELNNSADKTKPNGVCECCGKTGLPQELLFKIDSGQRVCAACLAKMDSKQY